MMNFMPSEKDAFFEEPVVPSSVWTQILESSVRQEKLLERVVGELERMNKRINLLETSSTSSKSYGPPESPTVSVSSSSRGTLVLPPGSRPPSLPNIVAEKKLPEADPEREEQEAILKRRAEEQARLARIESERVEREAEEQRKRLAELQKLEMERRMKQELDSKTRGLIKGLLTGTGNASLFAEDDLDVPLGGVKKSGGLFDDD
jgi:hypothetical protein